MKNYFFDEDGSLIINQTIADQPSYKKIMEDGIVSAEELIEQTNLVMDLFRKVEDTFTDEQKQLVRDLLVESNVLNVIFKKHGMQISIDND